MGKFNHIILCYTEYTCCMGHGTEIIFDVGYSEKGMQLAICVITT